MNNLLPYISAAGAFLAALIAVVGKPKWDTSQRGYQRLTPTGRFAVALAVVALASSIVLTWDAQRSADAQRVQRQEIRKLAHTELRLALQEIGEPFVGLLIRARHQMSMDPTGPIKTSGKAFPSFMLDVTDYALIVEETDVHPEKRQTNPSNFIRSEWEQNRIARNVQMRFEITRRANSAAAAIDRALPTYAAYLEPAVLYSVAELRRSRWLWQLQNLNENMPVVDGLLDGRFRRDDGFGYQRFWQLVEKLWNESDGLFRDSATNEVWGPDHPIMKMLRHDDREPGPSK